MFEQKLFNLPCWPDINEHAAKEISQWSDLVEPLDWFPPLLCKIIWLYNRKFVKLLGLFLIRCVFTKKILGGQKFVKTGTGKNRGFPEHCAMYQKWKQYTVQEWLKIKLFFLKLALHCDVINSVLKKLSILNYSPLILVEYTKRFYFFPWKDDKERES